MHYLPSEVHSIVQSSLIWSLLPVQTTFGAAASTPCASMSSSTTSLVHTTPSFPPWLDDSIPEYEHAISAADTRRHKYHRAVSSNSMFSSASVIVQPLRVRNENVIPSRTISLSTVDFHETLAGVATSRKLSGRVSHKSSWGTDIPIPPPPGDSSIPDIITDSLEDISLGATNNGANAMHTLATDFLTDEPSGQRLFPTSDKENAVGSPQLERQGSIKSNAQNKSHPFRRWVDTIHRKKTQRQKTLRPREERWSLDDFEDRPAKDTVLLQSPVHRRHRKSTSWASSGFVTAMKSASISLATLSVAPHSRRARGSTLIRSSNRSSRLSRSFNRPSLDESSVSGPTIDEAARERATKRRRTLEELVDSEESYVADLKVLVNVSCLHPFVEESPN